MGWVNLEEKNFKGPLPRKEEWSQRDGMVLGQRVSGNLKNLVESEWKERWRQNNYDDHG